MEMRFYDDGGLAIFELSGRITSLDGVEPLRRRFREAVSQGHRHYLFDLRQALFMDSSSIGEMCACLKRASEVSGSGLGLSLVNYIVKAHGGEVLVDSTAGRGSTFTISIPRQVREETS